jgi:N-acetyl-gamma-glutamyl-phosphate reductase
MIIRAAVAGASGYAGGELLRLLSGHPNFEVGAITANQSAGAYARDFHPQLAFLADRKIESTTVENLNGADVVFLALPPGESAKIVGGLEKTQLIVDLGADFRLGSEAAWKQFYGGEYAGQWTYGLPEFNDARALIVKSTRIANPGCYATSIILGLAPLLATSLIESKDIVVVAASGTSGAGRNPKPNLFASEVMGSMSTYKVGGVHQHTPEIEEVLSGVANGRVEISFTPLLAPMPRGIIATIAAKVRGTSTFDIRESLKNAYEGEPFVRLLPEGIWPSTASTLGSNAVQIQAIVDQGTDRAIITVVLDNLVKGAAGQAIQNANIALGLSETAGLSSDGIAP